MRRVIKKYWFAVTFVFILLFPVYSPLIKDGKLNGVTEEIEPVELSVDNVKQGAYQDYINRVYENSFNGRTLLINVRNQLLFSFFGVSPNGHVIVGKKNYLFEPEYINNELNLGDNVNENDLDELIRKLDLTSGKLAENGKELYVFITPSKAHFCREYIPDRYKLLEKKVDKTNYQILIQYLDKYGIKYYDSIAFMENADKKYNSPYYYKAGIHWSHVWGGAASVNLLDYIRENGQFDLPQFKITEEKVDEPIYPDADLYSSLNLIKEPHEDWYGINLKTEVEGKDHPNILVRGGSFLGQSISTLIRYRVFNEDIHIENNYYFMNRYSEQNTLSSYEAYDEIDLDRIMGNTDIVILEVNDAAIGCMSFGFIDYLYNHIEYLDNQYN